MKITTVVLHYWKERTKNIKRIVDDLQAGSLRPDKIVVFNNNTDIQISSIDGVSVINSNNNYEGRARYPIALLEPSDYYFFIDDDVTPCVNTLDNFVEYADKDCCLGYLGKMVNRHETYSNAKTFWGDKVTEPTDVDLLVGHGIIFASFNSLLKMFQTERELLKEGFPFGREEDLILSMSNRSKVIPAAADEFFVELPEGGVGYHRADKHIELRNKMVRRLL